MAGANQAQEAALVAARCSGRRTGWASSRAVHAQAGCKAGCAAARSQRAGGVREGGHDAGGVLILAGQLAVVRAVEGQGAVGQAQQDKMLRQRGAAGGKGLPVLAPAVGRVAEGSGEWPKRRGALERAVGGAWSILTAGAAQQSSCSHAGAGCAAHRSSTTPPPPLPPLAVGCTNTRPPSSSSSRQCWLTNSWETSAG